MLIREYVISLTTIKPESKIQLSKVQHWHGTKTHFPRKISFISFCTFKKFSIVKNHDSHANYRYFDPRQRNVDRRQTLNYSGTCFPICAFVYLLRYSSRRKRCDSQAYSVYETRVSSDVSRRRLGLPRVRRMRPINRINFKGIPRVARDSCRSSTVISRSSPSCIYHRYT